MKQIINPFTPAFLKWTYPSLDFDTSIVANRGVSQKSIMKMTNSVDPYEPSHLDLSASVYIAKSGNHMSYTKFLSYLFAGLLYKRAFKPVSHNTF